MTEKSDLCVWDYGPKFRYYGEENIELLPLNEYDPEKYWFYYRWQPDCDMAWRNHNAYTYQKEVYGLDFLNMTEAQLRDAAKKEVSRWNEMLKQIKKANKPIH